MSAPGPTRTTRCASARSCSPGWAARAAPSMASLGTKQTTISGVSRNPDQYSLAASAATCRPRPTAWSRSRADLSSSPISSDCASRKAVIGALASTTSTLSPGSRTTTSGRTPRPWALTALTCSSKSQRLTMPAASSTRRSCTSPQAPRTLDERSDPASEAVARPRCWVSPSTRASSERIEPNCAIRSRSRDPTWCSTRTSASLSGARRAAVSRSSARRGLEVDHPLAEQVALRDDGGRARGIQQPAHEHRQAGADHDPQHAPHPSVHGADSASGHRQGPQVASGHAAAETRARRNGCAASRSSTPGCRGSARSPRGCCGTRWARCCSAS